MRRVGGLESKHIGLWVVGHPAWCRLRQCSPTGGGPLDTPFVATCTIAVPVDMRWQGAVSCISRYEQVSRTDLWCILVSCMTVRARQRSGYTTYEPNNPGTNVMLTVLRLSPGAAPCPARKYRPARSTVQAGAVVALSPGKSNNQNAAKKVRSECANRSSKRPNARAIAPRSVLILCGTPRVLAVRTQNRKTRNMHPERQNKKHS